ncbi:hypothetical protein FLONG3_6237 [Fusarium longipes]|uniref:Reticulon-like protein n=1 Tax=Fusarium longipes TaxID=694270 RepID=A0A395SN00_9HYPO|nr:hypothetical protein FLONG3_6237 [Fusarium longipes]
MADSSLAANGNSLLETTKTSKTPPLRTNRLPTVWKPAKTFTLSVPLLIPALSLPGPVAQNVYDHTQKASNELSNLAASRRTPATPAATGQPLTHYHSFFSELLSWNNPRASAIAYATIVSAIFAARYLDVLRWGLKTSWMVLGVTILAEVLGKVILNNGLATQVRPRRYYTVPRETLDALIGDVHELINFFVIEAQRIVFAENVAASAAAFVAAFISYYLVKLVPIWGLALIGTTVAFIVPLIYTSNQELIDQQLNHASELINAQTSQIQSVASKQMEQVSNISKQYVGDYSGKVQDLLQGKTPSRQKIDMPQKPAAAKQPEFPSPPTDEPVAAANPPQIPTPAALREEINEPTAIDTAAPELPQEPVVPSKEPMLAS